MEEEEKRQAASITKTSLKPDSKPSGVTQIQLDKFQELQRRRLQIKSKFKKQLKPRNVGETINKPPQALVALQKDEHNEETDARTEETSGTTESTVQVDAPKLLTKRRKLHWGLDAKNRWERKANM